MPTTPTLSPAGISCRRSGPTFQRLGLSSSSSRWRKLSAADARLARGFDVLEGDHHAIHADMENTATTANALLHALAGDPQALRRCGEDYAAASGGLLKGLVRHLDDEEDLIVPLILDRGEEALGVAHHG